VKASPARPTELLAPAGDAECLRAAVANGADAVYFGLTDFNARKRATNFTLDELPETLAWLHRHNVRGYITFNTLVFDDELERAAGFVEAIARAGADAVIVQDLGLAGLIRRMVPSLPVHASTQMTLTEPAGVALAGELGVSRVILARELPLAEIALIARSTAMPLEVFVHGALCISYSGQCHASHVLMDRSANRGLCAQPCRLAYDLVADGRPLAGVPPYPLCPKDLAGYDCVRALVDAGVAALKIEGRLKDARYVAAAVGAYRAALDAALAQRPFVLDAQRRAGIEQSFSRGFTHGFLDGADHQDLVHGQSPKSRGLRVGSVVGRTPGGLVVAMDGPGAAGLKPGDGIVIDDGRAALLGETGGRVARVRPWRARDGSEAGGKVGRVAAARGREKRTSRAAPRKAGTGPSAETVEISFILDSIDLSAVPLGAELWKNDDPQVEKRLRKTFSRVEPARPTALTVEVRGEPGGPLCVSAVDADGREAAAAWVGPLEEARKHPLTAALAAEQFSRLGGTPFELARVRLVGVNGPVDALPVMAPKSALNELRRQVVESLMAQRATAASHVVADPAALEHARSAFRIWPRSGDAVADLSPRLCVLVRTESQLEAAIAWHKAGAGCGLAMVYVDFRDASDACRAVERCRSEGVPSGPATRRILRAGEERVLRALLESRPDAVLVRNPGSLSLCRQWAPGTVLVADASLNAANELTVGVLAGWSVDRVTPAVELDGGRLAALAGRVPAERLETVVYGRQAMFHMEHCLFASRLSGGRNGRDCGQPCRRHTLALDDRRGALMPVWADGGCRNTVYAATVRDDRGWVGRLWGLGVRYFRVELLDEAAGETESVLASISVALSCRPGT